MLQTSLPLIKNLNKTETPIFLSVVCALFPNAIVLDVYFINRQNCFEKLALANDIFVCVC